jgi:hypothetical protein
VCSGHPNIRWLSRQSVCANAQSAPNTMGHSQLIGTQPPSLHHVCPNDPRLRRVQPSPPVIATTSSQPLVLLSHSSPLQTGSRRAVSALVQQHPPLTLFSAAVWSIVSAFWSSSHPTATRWFSRQVAATATNSSLIPSPLFADTSEKLA